MFAPYCPVCRTRVLLGTRRIVDAEPAAAAPGSAAAPGAPAARPPSVHDLSLRCFCGTVVPWDNPVPARPSVPSGTVSAGPVEPPAPAAQVA